MRIISTLLLYLVCLSAVAQSDITAQIQPISAPTDTITIINSPDTPAPDDIYEDESVVIEHDESTEIAMPSDLPDWLISENISKQLVWLGDTSHKAGIAEFAVPAGIFAVSAMFVRTPWLVHWREEVQKHVSQHGRNKTAVDDWLQYSPMVAAYALHFCGMKGQHNLLDRTILLAMSYATFGVVNYAMKTAFKEKRPDITTIVTRYYDQDTWKKNLVFGQEGFELLQDILEDAGELKERTPYAELVNTEFAQNAS